MDYHGITMMGDFETDNIHSKDANGITMYDDSDIQTFFIMDSGFIKARYGVSIDRFDADSTFEENLDDDTLSTKLAIYTWAIGEFQPLSSRLTNIASLSPDERMFIVGTGSAWETQRDATARSSLGLGSAAERAAGDDFSSGSYLPDCEAITTYCDGRYLNEANNLSDLDDDATSRINLGVQIGVDVQAYSDNLTAIDAISPDADIFIVGSASNWIGRDGDGVLSILGLDHNIVTRHKHNTTYYQQSEFLDASLSFHLDKLRVSGTSGPSGYLYAGDIAPSATDYKLNYNGEFYATKVHNAVYNDIADHRPLGDILTFGKCYFDTKSGAKICNERCQKAVIGISSDTFGISCGLDKKSDQVPIAVAGWVLAYVDKEYEIGTPLTNDANGNLTEISDEEKRLYPERIIAVYSIKEENIYWNNINVDGRHWVKIK